MNFSVLLNLIPILVKYGPPVIAFIQQEGPAVQQFIKDVEAAFGQPAIGATGANVDIGAMLQKLFPQQGTTTVTTIPMAHDPALSGPGFVFKS
jgi:hypothetical protein